ncbi:MAG: class I SAM-dependent methyltransferase [Gammaproteobacteria bacterium]|nr:class I SAM-dependent methyltransferase [Gammaproteobacteria bacterium]
MSPTKTDIRKTDIRKTDMPEFDAAYYRRFYYDPATRAATPEYAKRQAKFISSYLRLIELPVNSVLDMGCGVGRVLKALGREFPGVRLTGVEYSEYLCQRHGWHQGSVTYWSGRTHDLVICNDVLGYLGNADCTRAINNLARLTRGALYLGALTREDHTIVDTDRTDPDQHLRSLAWYRRHMRPHFTAIGGGLFLRKPLKVPMWALDTFE